VTIAALAALVWGIYAATHRAERGLRAFWSPLSSDLPTILCVGNLDRQLLVDLQPEQRDAVARLLGPRSMVGPGNLAALNRISGLLGGYGKPTSVSMADAVSLSDLRGEPAIMIGIFDNAWSPRILANERFQFVKSPSGEHYSWLKDTHRPESANWRIDPSVPLPALQRDWALISRLRSSLTGRTEFVIAGISPYGTIAASEFITQPEYFQQFMDAAPRDWNTKDIQIVLSTDLVNGRSAPPHMVAFSLR
jgi:hypothetical protein